jgi:hypothetical protein
MAISLYNEEGRVVATIDGDPTTLQCTMEHTDQPWVEGDLDPEEFYVVLGKPVKRPEMNAFIIGKTLSGLPTPAVLCINDKTYDVSESTVELEFNFSGTYKVTVSSWPYLDKEFTVED